MHRAICDTCHRDIPGNVGYVMDVFAGKARSHHKECRPEPPAKPKVWVYLQGWVDED